MYSFSDFSTLKDLPDVKDDISNNLIECFNKQFKAWYKTKQGFSSFESANNLISLFVFFFNFVRPPFCFKRSYPGSGRRVGFIKTKKTGVFARCVRLFFMICVNTENGIKYRMVIGLVSRKAAYCP